MTVPRLANVGIVVDDLDAVTAFFVALGLEVEGDTTVEGPSVDRLIALDGVRSDIRMLRTPDGLGIELSRFHAPETIRPEPLPMNALGMRRVMFAVDDLDAALAALEAHGGELFGEVVRYGDAYKLCYVRGPEGILVALAERLS